MIRRAEQLSWAFNEKALIDTKLDKSFSKYEIYFRPWSDLHISKSRKRHGLAFLSVFVG